MQVHSCVCTSFFLHFTAGLKHKPKSISLLSRAASCWYQQLRPALYSGRTNSPTPTESKAGTCAHLVQRRDWLHQHVQQSGAWCSSMYRSPGALASAGHRHCSRQSLQGRCALNVCLHDSML